MAGLSAAGAASPPKGMGAALVPADGEWRGDVKKSGAGRRRCGSRRSVGRLPLIDRQEAGRIEVG